MRPGFALPLAMIILSFMAAGAVAVLSLSSAEVRVLDNQRHQTSAFALAETGLEVYLARGRVTPADTTIALPGGSARVRAMLLRPAMNTTDSAIYVIRSEGMTQGAGAVPQGRRTVAQLAYHVRGRTRVDAAWTSYSGVHKNGVSGMISGIDACGGDPVAGVSVPDGGYTQSGIADGETPVFGDPPIDEAGPQAEMAGESRFDWAGITDPLAPALAPDVIKCYSGFGYDARWTPCGSWPSTSAWADPDYWPTIVINGSGPLPTNGRGTLIVTGDLTFGGGDTWDGLILVGGRVVDNGVGTISGAVVSGLNVLPGDWVPQSSKANGKKNYQYDSCKVAQAVGAHTRLSQIPNAWVDNWIAW
jgi:hypothetical protein